MFNGIKVRELYQIPKVKHWVIFEEHINNADTSGFISYTAYLNKGDFDLAVRNLILSPHARPSFKLAEITPIDLKVDLKLYI
jgi:hypothetical protein